MSWLRDALEIARQTALLLARHRMSVLFVALSIAAAGAFALVSPQAARGGVPGDEFFGMIAYFVGVKFALPILTIYFGVTAVHGDLEDRTATFLFVRPVWRSALLVGKWLAVIAVTAVLAAVAIAALHAALWLRGAPWARGLRPDAAMAGAFALASAVGIVGYASAGAFFGAWFRRPLVAGAVFVVGWEVLVGNTPAEAGVRQLTVADPLQRWLLGAVQPTGALREMLALGLDRIEPASLGDPLAAVSRFSAVALLLALKVYTSREYDAVARD